MSIFAKLAVCPKGKDVPLTLVNDELIFKYYEIDSALAMFNPNCVGGVAVFFNNPLDVNSTGSIELNGEPLPNGFIVSESPIPHIGVLYQPMLGYASELDREYTLRIEGYRDIYGHVMEPANIPLRLISKTELNTAYAKNDKIALRAAREGIVLLKNNNTLPFETGATLNLFGSGVAYFRISAIGAGKINPRYCSTLLEAGRDCKKIKLNQELADFYAKPTDALPPSDVMERARTQSETAVMVISRGSSENIDNRPVAGEYYLTGDEKSLMKQLRAQFSKLTVILNTGYPIVMDWAEDADAIIYTGFAGMFATVALCEILAGTVNPSGHLPDTWPVDYFDLPSAKNFYNADKPEEPPYTGEDPFWADTCYEEGLYIGYRYFSSFNKKPAFWFGHGLSYTDFSINAALDQWDGENASVRCTVKNIGKISGKQVAQVYVQFPDGKLEFPLRQLVAFQKTKVLASGEEEHLFITIPAKRFSGFDTEQHSWIIPQGQFKLFCGDSVVNAEYFGDFDLEKEICLQRVNSSYDSPIDFTEISPGKKEWPTGEFSRVYKDRQGLEPKVSQIYPNPPVFDENPVSGSITYPMVRENPELLKPFVAQMSDEELCRFNVMYSGGWSMDSIGEAGRMAHGEKYELPMYRCADGNSGVNIPTPNVGMPSGVVMCATFDPDLMREIGQAIGTEAKEHGLQMILAPGMNIHRNPLNGRHPEYFSEDPLLSGIIAAGFVNGLHDAGVSDSVKHVACNNCETLRKRNNSLVRERTLREIYLKNYEILMEYCKPDSIMTGYNALNGCMVGESPVLIDEIFRGEFGFDGFVMTDWGSYATVNKVDAVKAGTSWLAPGENDGSIVRELMDALVRGELTRGHLENNLYNVIKVILRRNL